MKQTGLARLFSLTARSAPFFVVVMFLCSVCGAAYDLSIALLLQTSLDSIVNSDMRLLMETILGYGGAVLLASLGASGFSYIYRSIAVGLVGKLRETVFAHLIRLPVSFYGRTHSGDLISRLNSDMATLEPVLTGIPLDITSKMVSGAISLAYLGSIDSRLAAYGVAVGALSLLSSTLSSRTLRRLTRIVQERLSVLAQALSDLLSGIMVIKAFGLLELLKSRFDACSESAYVSAMHRVRRRAQLGFIGNFVFFATQIGLVILGSYLAITGSITVGAVVGAMGAIGPVVRLCSTLVTNLGQVQTALAGADRVFELLDQSLEGTPKCDEVDGSAAFLRVENVTFSYPGATARALDEVSFEVGVGETVALVGPSGGGKSTLFRLILGFYSPDSGGISIAGAPISKMALTTLRELIAYVPQQPYLFTGTIAENIACGREGACWDDIVNAAKTANAHDFVASSEQGYDTQVGERGLQLSGGQRQRIAVARAILKDAPLLLLDEATSSVDSESEGLMRDALDALMGDRATVVIAHRLSTVRKAHRILVLENGRVIEAGTHEDLMRSPEGVYSRLLEKQFGTGDLQEADVDLLAQRAGSI